MKTYRTSEVATFIGIHPNTVRLYEDWGLITKPERQKNGYRIYTDLHIQQFQLARKAFQSEIIQNGLRNQMIDIIKTCAKKDYDGAIRMTEEYLHNIRKEYQNAEEAIRIVQSILQGEEEKEVVLLKRKEVSDYLDITMDTLRNWELNGLIHVKRKQNGYRVYTEEDIKRLKIIRCLRCANYSLESILRMLGQLSQNPDIDIKAVLDTPNETDDIISACDRLMTSLLEAEDNAKEVFERLKKIKQNF